MLEGYLDRMKSNGANPKNDLAFESERDGAVGVVAPLAVGVILDDTCKVVEYDAFGV